MTDTLLFKNPLGPLKVGRMKKPHKPKGHWSPEKKIEVVTKWLAIGNMRKVSEDTGVSYVLIREWRTQPWWKEIEAEIRASRVALVDTKLSRIVDKSLELLQDRLVNGDFVLNQKTGEVHRKPVSALVANKVAVDMLTRQVAQQKLEVEVKDTNTKQTIQDQLKMLAAEFAKFNGSNPQLIVAGPVETIEEEWDEFPEGEEFALHEEWETRLQDGSEEIYEQAGSGEETDGTEPSSGGNGESREST